jgi:hypothetical protein
MDSLGCITACHDRRFEGVPQKVTAATDDQFCSQPSGEFTRWQAYPLLPTPRLFAIIVSANFTILLLIAALVASYAQLLRLLKDFLLPPDYDDEA